ncbi:acyl-CoA synthetase [Ramlibacter sp.]|uniref:acyl-CoA synthetase n=1 Tax=Ramlibacter sp. TaxID=1917967 RepID=UPI002CDD2316|nr:AMP-binding protein [Ramlibacter sp.]HWI82246.1 AMP-binding protein [Ramlibacter sp.]
MSASQCRDNHARMHAGFGWRVPVDFNIAQACCTRWANRADAAQRIAIRAHGVVGEAGALSYQALQQAADRLSHSLAALGVGRGDRVAIVMPQRFETAIAYMAVFQMGAVAMPLSMLFGPDALEYRLRNGEAAVAICDDSSIGNVASIRASCPSLRAVIGVGAAALRADLDWRAELDRHRGRFPAVATRADDGAVLIYTSGTTGPPKGALIPHRALIGNLPGFVCSQNWFGFDPGPDPANDLAGEVPARIGPYVPAPTPALPGEAGASPHVPAPTPALPRTGEGADTGATVTPSPSRGRAGVGGSPNAGTRSGEATSATPSGSDRNTPVFWSPADWAWTGGLMDALLPTLYFGCTIVGYNGRFSPELAFELMQQHRVSHTFLFPTALKAMMKAFPEPRRRFRLQLQAIMSAGEAVGDAVFGYCRDQLGVVVNEMFGQTEINYVVGNCSMAWSDPTGGAPVVRHPAVGWPARPGSMGRPYPGHRIAVIDDDGHECPVGVPGDVAVNRYDVHGDPDPIFFLGYWRNEGATRAKFTGDWCRTGDLATRDADGYLWYQGRADDVFKAAGYRIGPSEIENCLVKHPAVVNAAVVPKPDRERGAVVKAFVVLAPDYLARRRTAGFDAELIAQLQAHVKGKLAPYEYPKEIEFIDALPMTTTGKVQRRVLRLREEERARQAQ